MRRVVFFQHCGGVLLHAAAPCFKGVPRDFRIIVKHLDVQCLTAPLCTMCGALMHVVRQGSGDARYVTARLMPLQHDSPEEQLAQVPGLAALPTKERAALILQQPPTDDLSFLGWCRSLGVYVPAAPDRLSAVLAHMTLK